MNTTNTTSHYLGPIWREENWNLVISLPLALLYLLVMANIFKTHRYSLEPVHIFELNILASAALLIINNSLFGFDPFFDADDYYCGFVHFFGVYNAVSLYIGIIFSQVDRLLALYWNVSYKGRVTPELATKILVVQKLLLLVVIVFCFMFDSAVGQCHVSSYSLCQVRSTTEHWARAVFWLMIAAVLSVSLYVLVIKVRSSRKVQPTVNLPSHPGPELPTISSQIEDEVDEDIVLEDVENMKQDDLEEAGDDEEIEKAADLKRERRTNMVQRQNPDPFMFYRIKSLKESKPLKTEKITCLPNKWSFVDNTRRARSFNLVSLCLLVMLMPTKLQELYFSLTGAHCDGDSAMKVSRLLIGTELLFGLMYPFIIKSKLHHQN